MASTTSMAKTSMLDISRSVQNSSTNAPAESPPLLPSLSTPTNALQLGEILKRIALYLPNHDLYSCTLVSFTWYAAVNPLLWRTIAVSESRHQPSFLSTLSRQLNLVNSLQWEYTDWWEFHHVSRERKAVPAILEAKSLRHNSESQNSVSSVRVLPTGRPVFHPPTLTSFPTTAVIRNLNFGNATSLRSLVLDGPFEMVPLLETLQQSSPMLRCLRLKNTNCMRREVLPVDLFLKVSPNLEHCSIRTNAQIHSPYLPCSGGSNSEPSTRLPSLALKTLELDIQTLTGVQLMVILLQCPHLESFTATEYGLVSSLQDLEQQLRSSQPFTDVQMNTYSRTQNVPSQKNVLGELLEGLPTFARQGVKSVRFSDVGLTILQYCCPKITSLDLRQASSGKIQSRTLQRFLQSCKGLLHLQARSVAIMAEDMIDPLTGDLLLWSCRDLETLSVAFGVVRPQSDGQYQGDSSANAQYSLSFRDNCMQSDSLESRTLWEEKTVYRQLSMLTKLRVLEIPQSFMRLEVGMGVEMLATLSQLCEFSIAGPKVAFAEKAVNMWFQQHWPKLNRAVIGSRVVTMKTVVTDRPSSSASSFSERRRSC